MLLSLLLSVDLPIYVAALDAIRVVFNVFVPPQKHHLRGFREFVVTTVYGKLVCHLNKLISVFPFSPQCYFLRRLAFHPVGVT